MKALHTIFSALLIILLAGCAGNDRSSQEQRRGLEGTIASNTYTAADKSFSVKLPYPPGSPAYERVQIKENYTAEGAYVSFGPAASDPTIYRIETAKRVAPPEQSLSFDAAARSAVQSYRQQLEGGYDAPMQEVAASELNIDGRRTLYWKYSQTLPVEENKTSDEPATLMHEAFIVDFGDKGAAVIWIQSKKGADTGSRRFAKSLVMY